MITFKKFLEEKRGLWDNIHAKQERIKHGSGEKMRKPGSKGAPTDAALKASQNEELEQVDENSGPFSSSDYMPGQRIGGANLPSASKKDTHVKTFTANREKEASEFAKKHGYTVKKHTYPAGHTNLHPHEYQVHKEEAEAQFDLIEEMVMELASQHNIDPEVIWEKFEDIDDEQLLEYAVDAKGHKSSTGGLTQKGRDAYNRTEGSHLKAPVTTPPSKLKAGSKAANRRKSFCARMGGVEGPMKKPNGEPTRKALALRKWNC